MMVSMKEYEQTQHELEILRLPARGEKEIEAGVCFDLETVTGNPEELDKTSCKAFRHNI